jgi:hypothetical protein
VSLEALPALAPGAIPPEVRGGGPDAVAGFRTALGFERTLLTQMLSEAMPQPEEGADPREASMPSNFADALISQGGLGMADQLYSSFEPHSR